MARDVIGHLIDWMSVFVLSTWTSSTYPDPRSTRTRSGAWNVLNGSIQSVLDTPGIAGRDRDTPMGQCSFAHTIDRIATPDILIRTWDLARATGLDEDLDSGEVHRVCGARVVTALAI